MKASTLSGNEIDLAQDLIDGFRMRIRGPVLLPDESGYEEARTLWNGMIDRKPALVARCEGIADVIESVRFARKHDLLLCIKSGGDNGGAQYRGGAISPALHRPTAR